MMCRQHIRGRPNDQTADGGGGATAETDRAAGLLRQAGEIREAIGAPVPTIERPAFTATRAAIWTR
jgi:hypothetical protein